MSGTFDQLTIPDAGERIEYDDEFHSPDTPILPVAPGVDDQVVAAARSVLDAAAERTGRSIHWLRVRLGDAAVDREGIPVPRDTIQALRRYRVGLVGRPSADPQVARDVIGQLFEDLDLTVAMEHRSGTQWAPSPTRNGRNIDLTVFRNLTEDAAAGIEYAADATATGRFRERLLETTANPDAIPAAPAGFGVRPISKEGTATVVEAAMEYALDRDRDSLTVVHQGDQLPDTEGAFARWARTVLHEEYGDATIDEATFEAEYGGTYPEDEIVVRERHTDDVCRALLTAPGDYDVIVAPAEGGSMISTIAAESIGGLGMAPQVAIGEGYRLATTRPTYPGGPDAPLTNPVGTMHAGCLLFETLGWADTAAVVRNAITRTFADGYLPRELAGHSARGTPLSAESFAAAVLERLTDTGPQPGWSGVRTSGDERAGIRRIIAGLYTLLFDEPMAPGDIVLNQLLDPDEEADVYLPEVGINFAYWRRWSAERRLEVLLHELAHVGEAPDERDHGAEFYDRLVALADRAAESVADLETLFGEPIDPELVARHIVESVHEETIEEDLETVRDRRRMLRAAFDLDAADHY